MKVRQLQRAIQLKALGARVDSEILEEMQAQYLPISIRQVPGVHEIYDVSGEKTGFEVAIVVSNDSEQMIRIRDYRIILPWTNISLLPKPRKTDPDGDAYYIPLDYHRHPLHVETVLNHRLRRGERFFPAECVQGFLVGFGIDAIPPGYTHGQKLPVTLWLAHSRGIRNVELTMTVIRSRPVMQPSQRRVRRKPLLASRDPSPSARREDRDGHEKIEAVRKTYKESKKISASRRPCHEVTSQRASDESPRISAAKSSSRG